MRRDLAICLVVGSLLWAVSGVSVLALVFHEHAHHADSHDHLHDFRAVIHGHSHEGTQDHDCEITAPTNAARVSLVHPVPESALEYAATNDGASCARQRSGESGSENRDHRPPSYLMHCVLLT